MKKCQDKEKQKAIDKAAAAGGGLGLSMRTEALNMSAAQRSGPTSPEGTITPRRSPLSHTVRLHTRKHSSRQNR